MSALVVATAVAAGALGALLRYATGLAAQRRPGRLPWAVLVVNVLGSALGGAVLGLSQAAGLDDGIRLIILGGFCGGLTTFSTLSLETVELVLAGRVRAAAAGVSLNLALGIGAAAATWALVHAIAS